MADGYTWQDGYLIEGSDLVEPLAVRAETAATAADASADAAAASQVAAAAAATSVLASGIAPELPLTLASSFRTEKIVEGAGTITPSVYEAAAWVNGQARVIDIIAKASERRFLNIFCGSFNLFDATFDLALGTVVYSRNGGTATITPLGGGFYLCSVRRAADAGGTSNLQLRVGIDADTFSYTGDGTSGILVASVYHHRLGQAADLFLARLLSDPTWTKQGATIGSVVVTNTPAGVRLSAVEDSINGRHPVKLVEAAGSAVSPSLYIPGGWIAGKSYRAYAVAKKGERKRLNIYSNGGPFFDAIFDLDAGTASGAGASITDRGDGEYLCEVVKVSPTSSPNNLQFRVLADSGSQPYAGDGTSGLFLIEVGQYQNKNLQISAGPAEMLSGTWGKQDVTASLSNTRFAGIDDKLDRLFRGDGGSLPLVDKKWAALGDSITEGGAYTAPMAAQSGMVLTNLGWSGKTIGLNGVDGTAGIRTRVSSIPTNSDVVTLLGGINDFALNTPLGTLGDTTKSTFYGGLYEIVFAIWARAPNAILFVASPTPGGGSGAQAATHSVTAVNGLGLRLRDYQRAVEQVCLWLGVAFTDVGRQCGINETTANRYLDDGLHPNDLGGRVVASYWLADIQQRVQRGLLLA